ncbi:chromosome partitioning protein ParA [Terribacillus saccharophilus]|uniref:Mrp/NBP35 family ATP-binding protein n=1 Tax=Terribacillus saccharophilus TaxID=361277 RepID=UPI000BA7A6E3|nr:Mrp/NBP35 family ATP-binding protein [Terribacillus saccharophilus]PAF20220.1 chromosome partitioning protein ParA [Terribacillus saccharophilus]
MVTEEKVRELLNDIEDPFLHTALGETGAIADIRIKEEKRHVSVKILVGKANTAEQMQLQQEIVNVLKNAGAATVGLRFDQLPQDVVDRYSQTQSSGKQKSLLDKDTKTKFINIASGKGGVGKSTVTVNLAVALTRIGFKVGIIDADIYGFSVPEMMGIEKRPEVVDDKITPVERFGVKIISMGFFVEDNGPVIWRGPMLGKMLTSFFKEVQWGDDLDYLLVDLPPGTGDVALDIHTMLPSSKEIIVTTPHPNAAFVAARAGQMALRTEHEILGVVENMAYYEVQATGEKEYVFGQGGGDKLADALETEVIGRLPLAQPYKEEGVFAPAVYQENHPLGDAYDDLARAILEKYMQ